MDTAAITRRPGFRLPETDPGRAVVVGAGPNGLTAAALLARAGWVVDLFEAGDRPGGASATAEPFGAGVRVDLGAAGHPFGAVSPAFHELGLTDHGLRWLHPEVVAGHPLPGGDSALLLRDPHATAEGLGEDGAAWLRWHAPVLADPYGAAENILGPLVRPWPSPVTMARFGLRSPLPATVSGRLAFRTEAARALFVGSAVHAIMPPSRPLTGAFATVFGGLGMRTGWPVAEGGSGAITDALASVLALHGGRLHTGRRVTSLTELPAADAVVLDLTPRQVLALDGADLPAAVARPLRRWRYGAAASKVDFLLSGPVPWSDPRLRAAGTVHVGGSAEQIQHAETEVAAGRMPETPFVMVCQQQSADPSRVRGRTPGTTVVWAYAHVPHGWNGDARSLIEAQIERHAPGFRDTVVEVRETRPQALEAWNPNLVGGDIAGGAMSGLQLMARPRASAAPHRLRGAGVGRPALYLASAATPPGAGVHGMGGAWAVRTLLRDRRRGR